MCVCVCVCVCVRRGGGGWSAIKKEGGEGEEGRTKQRGSRKECVKLHDGVGRD